MATNKLLEEKLEHLHLAKKAVDSRLDDWDEKDELYMGFVDPTKTVSRAKVTDSMPFRLVIERASRVMANKPRGHFSPREGGDVLSARILDEYISYCWDKANHGGSMIYKWWLTVLGALKYGTAFSLVPWWFERRVTRQKENGQVNFKKKIMFEGPEFKPLPIRDCFPDPSATTVQDCKWFQVRSYVTLPQLEAINDANTGTPTWQNLEVLRKAVEDKTSGDSRSPEHESRIKRIRGIEDYTGRDKEKPDFEIYTEYSSERWVTFSEKYNVILRDIPNPLYSGEIPIIGLSQYPLEDDLYGLGELEPVKRLLRASSSLINQALDETNMKLYSPLKVDPSKVEPATIKWAPGAKWIVSDMNAIQEHVVQSKFIQHFVPTYSFLISAIQNASGTIDLSQNVVQARRLGETATGARFTAQAQNTRDNLFRSFLEDQIKRQMEIWLQWVQQYTTKEKVIRVAGRQALEFFRQAYTQPQPTEAGELKFVDQGEFGFLTISPEDIIGSFDYIPEVGSTQDYDPAVARNNLLALFTILTKPEVMGLLQTEKKKIKMTELLEELFYKFDIKNPSRFFEEAPEQTQPVERGVGRPPEIPPEAGSAFEAPQPAEELYGETAG